jgi:hypothetical protein
MARPEAGSSRPGKPPKPCQNKILLRTPPRLASVSGSKLA